MANATNKDQFILDYDKQRSSFIDALKRFNTNKGTPFDNLPEIGGQEVDLYHLYQKVTSMGGFHKVNNEQLWERILDDFFLPQACTNAVEVLKHVYYRYLNLYEKVNFLGEDVDLRKMDDEDGPTRKKICLPIESIPLNYNYNQHKLTDAQRQHYNLSTDLVKRNPYEKLELSLHSGLPNDVDHAVNVCILLSTEGRHTINLHKASHMIELLLAHIGIFDGDDLCMEDLYFSCWTKHSGRDFLRFWYESVKRKDIRSLITVKGHVYSQNGHQMRCTYTRQAVCESTALGEMAGEDVLNLGRDIGVGDIEGQRVLQMGAFIRNLSFEECNQKLLASSGAVFKFIVLSLNNTYGNLRQLALDTLANLAGEICLVSAEDFNTQILLDFIHESLVSEDRFCLVRGMEVMSKMCQVSVNKSVLSSHIKADAYSRLVNLLTIQDIQIIVHSLEALYKLSKAGEPFTTRIAKVHKAIDTLVSLITIEAQSFGPGSLVGIKVVEYTPPQSVGDRDVVKRPTTVIQPVDPDCINIYQIPSSQLAGITADSKGGELSAPPKPKKPVTDIHATSTNWLKATFEIKKRSKVNQVELFSDYLQFCRKFGIENPLTSADFLQMVKKIFDQVEILSINRKNGDRDVFFEGICRRSTQLPFAVTTIQEDKVSKPLNVNVSLQQTPQPPPPPASSHVSSTLRQRLMEPLRHSLSPHNSHTGASSTIGNPKTADTTTPSGKPPPTSQLPIIRKPGGFITTPMAKGKRKLDECHTPQSNFSNFVQNGPTSEGMASSSDASCVKSLLAKKLCQVSVESAHSDHPSSNHHSTFNNTITSQPFSTTHSPGTFVVCPAVTSNSVNPSHRPIYQQGKSAPAMSDSWSSRHGKSLSSQATTCVSQSTSTIPSAQSSQTRNFTPQSSSSSPSVILSSHIRQTSVASSVTPPVNECNTFNQAMKPTIPHNPNTNQGPTVGIGMSISSDSNSNVPCVVSQNLIQNGAGQPQGSNLQGGQPFNQVINTSIATYVTPQPQQINVQTLQQQPSLQQHINSGNVNVNVVTTSSLPNPGLTVMQQQGSTISVIPQQQSCAQPSLQGSNLITVGPQTAGIVQQHPQQLFPTHANPSLTFNQIIRTPSSNVQQVAVGPQPPQQQQTMVAPQIVSMATANATQSISSPAMATLLTSTGNQLVQGQVQQPQQQMVLSTPLQGNRPGLGGVTGVPSNMVIQTQPGTLVMPSRQVLVQGNGGAAVGTVQQRQAAGTVSFVVPQYRQTSSVIIQQSGGVNVLPSLALQTQQALSQPNPPTAQTLAGQMSTTLGPRQIVINQSQLPMGMQISSLPGNAGSICLAPQQQSQQASGIVIQPNTLLNQPPPANNLQLTMNGTQVVRNESLPSRSDVVTVNHNQLQDQQQVQGQLPPQQQSQPNPSSQLVIQTSHMPQQQQQVPVTSLQCNGVSHEVNGILGSPDSISSDLPPSPQSTGMHSDLLNGQLSDSDSNKSDLAKLVDKTGRPKINGIIHNFENACFNNGQPPKVSPVPPGVSIPQPHPKSDTSSNNCMTQSVMQETLSHNSQIRIVNGSGTPVSSFSQQSVTGRESSGNAPQKIIVNVVKQQQNRGPQVGGNNTANGFNPHQPQVTNVNGQQQQQQQMVGPPIQQQNQNQQQQLKNPIFQRVMMNSNNNTANQQQQHPQIIKLIPKHLKKPQNYPVSSTTTANPPLTPTAVSRPQSRISMLPCPSPAVPSSPVALPPKVPSKPPPIITRPTPSINTATSDKKMMCTGQGTQTNISVPLPKRQAAVVAMTDKTPIRLRKKKGEADSASDTPGQTPVSIVLEYKCEWGSCRKNFPSARHVFLHVFRQHIPKAKESCCQWFSCEKLVRKRWSLVSHIQDYHCSEMAMRSACHRRFTLSQNPSAPLPPPPPQPMVYPPDAASQAIRRFAIKPPFPEFAEQREGPVSKHIRLTAALILRNVCHHSALGRKLISRHESELNYNCMSRMDSSTALSSCLWDILHYGEAPYKSSTTASHLS